MSQAQGRHQFAREPVVYKNAKVKYTNPTYRHSYFCNQKFTAPPSVPMHLAYHIMLWCMMNDTHTPGVLHSFQGQGLGGIVYPCQDGTTKPLPSVAQIFQDPTLSGTKFGLISIPLLAQIHIKVPKSGLLGQLLARSTENPANLVLFFTIYTLHPWHKN